MQDKVIGAPRVCAPCAAGDHGKCRVKLYGCTCALCAPDRSPYVREIDGEAFLSQTAVQKAIAAENEACEKVALAFEYHDATVHDIAAAIRARR